MKEKTTYHPTYVHQVIDALKAEIRKEYGLNCCGRGGSMPTDIRSISIDFETKKSASIESSRELLINVIERLQEIINKNEDIRPFLREDPFPVKRIMLAISFNKKPLSEDDSLMVEYILIAKGRIYYSQREKDTYKHIDIHEETYEEAMKIIESKNGKPKV